MPGHPVDRRRTRICAFTAISMHPTELRDRRGCPNNPAWSTRVSDTHMQCAYGTSCRKPSNTNPPLYTSDGHSHYSARGREKRTGPLNNLPLPAGEGGEGVVGTGHEWLYLFSGKIDDPHRPQLSFNHYSGYCRTRFIVDSGNRDAPAKNATAITTVSTN